MTIAMAENRIILAESEVELNSMFQHFRDKKLEDLKNAKNALNVKSLLPAAKMGGEDLGEQFVQGFKHEMMKFDAVLAGSAEAITRFAAYQDALEGEGLGLGKGGRGRGGSADKAFEARLPGAAPDPRGDKMLALLEKSNEHLGNIEKKTGFDVAEVGFG